MNYVMRDGTVARDPRLGRIEDPQTAIAATKYPMSTLLRQVQVQRRLRSYTWSVNLWLDQGQEGACVGFGINHERAARPKVTTGITNQSAQEDYWEIQKNDEWPGGSYPGADPHYDGTSVRAGMDYFRQRGDYKSYWWANDEEDVAYALGYKGPVVIGVDWKEGMFEPDSKGYLNLTGDVMGGHCTLLYGINVNGGYYKLWNSWGRGWGDNGTAKLRREDLASLLRDGGEAAIPVRA